MSQQEQFLLQLGELFISAYQNNVSVCWHLYVRLVVNHGWHTS